MFGLETSLFSMTELVSPLGITLLLTSVCTAFTATVALGLEDKMKTDREALESGGTEIAS